MTLPNRVELMKRQLDGALRSLDEPGDVAEGCAPEEPAAAELDQLRTATRLVVGALLLAADELARRAPEWERLPTLREAAATATPDSGPAPLDLPELTAQPQTPQPASRADNQLMLALIGWSISLAEQLRAGGDPRHLVEWTTAQFGATLAVLGRGSLAAVSGGRLGPRTVLEDPDIERWIALGQVEVRRSRVVAGAAITSLLQEVIAYLAAEPAVQQLVQQQGTTLSGDVLDEVRECTVSGDTLVDSLVHKVALPPIGIPAPEDA